MTTFANFSNILPDPSHRWGAAGEENASTGYYGPGFVSITVDSAERIMRTTSNSQRSENDIGAHHQWELSIDYNDLIRQDFEMVYNFLLHKQIVLTPFYVSVPQYAGQVTTNKTTIGTATRGTSKLTVTGTGITPGEIFKFNTHTKIYKVTRVETYTANYAGDTPTPLITEERIHFTPGLQEDVPISSTLIFTDPMFYVVVPGETIGYSLDSKNLYSFNLKLEEVTI